MGGEARLSNDNMSSLLEMEFVDMFSEIAEEEGRLKGGPYRKGFIPIEEMLTVTPDMEGMIDERRTPPDKELEKSERGEYYYFRPKPHDLTPFHAIMASVSDDLLHPSFSSRPSGRARITYHRGGKTVRPKKEVFT